MGRNVEQEGIKSVFFALHLDNNPAQLLSLNHLHTRFLTQETAYSSSHLSIKNKSRTKRQDATPPLPPSRRHGRPGPHHHRRIHSPLNPQRKHHNYHLVRQQLRRFLRQPCHHRVWRIMLCEPARGIFQRRYRRQQVQDHHLVWGQLSGKFGELCGRCAGMYWHSFCVC